MRVRSKGNTSTTTVRTYYSSTEGRWLQPIGWAGTDTRDVFISNYTQITTSNSQIMNDTTETPGEFNPVGHTKRCDLPIPGCVGSFRSFSVPWVYAGNWGNWFPVGIHSVGIDPTSMCVEINIPGGGSAPAPFPEFSSIDWSSLVDEVGLQLDGSMKTSQNLMVDLSQLSQTIGMFKNPMRLKDVPKLARGFSLGKLSRSAASGYLEYKFGWENIYRDIKALSDVWSEVSHRISYLKESVGKWSPIAARRSETIQTPNVGNIRTISFVGGSLTPRITRAVKTAAFSLQIFHKEEEIVWSKMDHVLKRLGAHDVFSTLWDIVPYSFVVDWFTHANRVLEQRYRNFGSYTLRRIGSSTKTTLYADGILRLHTSNYDDNPYTEVHIPESPVATSYSRSAGFPAWTSTVGLFGNLNLTQMLEGTALIMQRI